MVHVIQKGITIVKKIFLKSKWKQFIKYVPAYDQATVPVLKVDKVQLSQTRQCIMQRPQGSQPQNMGEIHAEVSMIWPRSCCEGKNEIIAPKVE